MAAEIDETGEAEVSDEIQSTDIALVGMAGRFPGAADVDELWATIRAGRSGIRRFTDAELLANGVSPELIDDPAYVKAGAVIDGVEEFDAGFFGINPKEAQILDPQHRLLLEHCWHALEDAGCDPARFDGAVGVFAGTAWSTYLINNLAPAGAAREMGDMAVALANEKDTLATRVAHLLGLSGPAFAIQSACSTSLVAVCVAASSLANFECDLALAGGVSLAVPHQVGYLYQEGGIAPPDGECRAFDAAGLGAPLGGGVGVVSLRRLEDALADGDRVYAVLRGWAVNNDAGRKVGFTAPGVEGQAAVIAEALAAAGLEPSDIDYVEAHGTGTALGDASEIAALQRVFHGERLRIGSIKTNVGHLDRAAGVTGLIKTALSLHRDEIPPTLNLRTPNPQLATGSANLEVVTETQPWPRGERKRRAGVSAFGIGGTNAHVIVEEAPTVVRDPSPRQELLVWSARNAKAADEMGARLADHLAATEDSLADVANTLQNGRSVFPHRRIVVAGDAQEAAGKLRDGDFLTRHDGRTDRGVGFLLAGAGEQYPGMARHLYETEPVFAMAIDACMEIVGLEPLQEMLTPRKATSTGLAQLMGRATTSTADATDCLHPALFAVEYALAQLVRSWGVEPSVLVGYSLGEYVAACLAGVLSLEDALRLVAHRAKLINALPGGAMAAIPRSAEELRHRLDGVDIAAINGPELTVVSGESITELKEKLAADSIPCRPLATTHAFHSRMLAPIRDELTEWIKANVTLHAPTIPYVSNVTGQLVTEAPAPEYWAEHMCAPVQFDTAVATVLAQGDLALVEIGPGQSLGAMVRGHRDCAPDRWPLIVSTVPAADDRRESVLAEAAGRLWLAGVSIDWAGYQGDRELGRVGLPTYPFQRERYWIDAPKPVVRDNVELLAQRWRPAQAGDAAEPAQFVIVPDAGGVGEALTELLCQSGFDAELSCGDLYGTVVDLSALDAVDEVTAVTGTARTLSTGEDLTVLVVTRGGQAVGGEPVSPIQAAIAALPVVANQEYLNLEARNVDLDPAYTVTEAAQALAAELTRPTDAVLVAHRADRRYSPDYEPVTPSAATLKPGGTYLVTGGLGTVGRQLAQHFADAGAKRIILTSRGGGEIDVPNAEVRRIDVTDVDAMRALFEEGRIDGVVHAAASAGPSELVPLAQSGESVVAQHFGAKVEGARVLATIIATLPEPHRPDWCVLFSSTSSVLGGVTLGAYAAANAALTALARNENWTCAAWDTWPGTLDRLDGRIGATMAKHAMTRAEALNAFDRVVGHGGRLVVAAGGLNDRLPVRSAVHTLPRQQTTTKRYPRPELPQPFVAPGDDNERALADIWSSVLGVEPVGTRDNFFDLGGNSLIALHMLALVRERLGVSVPTATLFELPTVRALVAQVLDTNTETEQSWQ
ncbi:type I polyketide synthase [Kutzneria kofuensis]|uniref:Acyl transferase domain-containing protein/acyl carrier protein n=1 Tax=Kutzneria kofuensis TaxID=103725 RepID=A0A7W9NKL8_9PSEU|nr:type I polyketide synthase [Kutzneria kofuensis]MBB5895824.1 acyl transferase domain-containing protein/acyl carrier protein [Kutzneria kofuensis]